MIDGLKILNWNVRGLNEAARRETVVQLVKDNQPLLVCFQETKLQNITSQLAREIVGNLDFQFAPANGTCGGILLAWNPDLVIASNLLIREFSLLMNNTMRMTNVSFLISVVYGPTEDADKGRFMEELKSMKPSDETAWTPGYV